MPGPLVGVRVLDFTWALAGPFATMQLADLGAEVVKVEYPGLHEKERGFGPYFEGISTFLFSVNRGKKGICVDLKSAEGRDLVLDLAREADVVAENFRPGTMARLGLGYEAMRMVNPRLVYAALSGFGQYGPYSQYAAVDAVAQAMGGTMHLNGYPERPPLRVGVSIGDMVGGLYLALGVVAALRHRDATGEGQLLDVSLVDAQVALCENAIVRHSAFDEDPSRIGAQHPLIAPFGPYPSRDGFIVIANVKEWDLFCGLIERDDLALDPRFTTNRARLEHAQTLDDELARTLQTRTTDAWYEALRATNVCAVGKVNSIADLFDDPHVAAREMLVDLPLPYGVPGKLTVAGSPLKFSGTPVELQAGMPEYGGATDEVLAQWLGRDPGSTALLRERGVIR